jgi:hypothetical protein
MALRNNIVSNSFAQAVIKNSFSINLLSKFSSFYLARVLIFHLPAEFSTLVFK